MELLLEDRVLGVALDICRRVRSAGGRGVFVGGVVRDTLLGRASKDCDIEVFGLAPARLKAVLAPAYGLDLVGESFGVLKVRGCPIDVSVPRRESKAGRGHKGFEIASDPALTAEEAAARRDFTVNAMSYDPLDDVLIDPCGGRRDLAAGVLRHTSPKFVEDPLRVLRGMQFAARFALTPAPDTVRLCRAIEPEGLAPERVFDEWRKLVLLGAAVSTGLAFLRDTGWVRYTPELAALIDCPQEPDWHPEGDVWVHTLHSMDAFAAERIGDDREDLVVGLAVLCHDFGKPATTTFEDGRIRSRGHCEAGVEPTQRFLGRMTRQADLIRDVTVLVAEHLRPMELHGGNAGPSAIRRLARRVKRIDRLVRVARADYGGRPGLDREPFEAADWLLERARELEIADAAPAPIVMGRHLIEMGLTPGPAFGPILEACYEAQLGGDIATLEEGLDLARRLARG